MAYDNVKRVGEITTTKYCSIPACAFMIEALGTNSATYDDGSVAAGQDNTKFHAPVFLPNGAIVTAVNVRAGSAICDYHMYRVTLSDGTETEMATALLNTEDTTISNATIDNSLYAYTIKVADVESAETFYGALVTYTIVEVS